MPISGNFLKKPAFFLLFLYAKSHSVAPNHCNHLTLVNIIFLEKSCCGIDPCAISGFAAQFFHRFSFCFAPLTASCIARHAPPHGCVCHLCYMQDPGPAHGPCAVSLCLQRVPGFYMPGTLSVTFWPAFSVSQKLRLRRVCKISHSPEKHMCHACHIFLVFSDIRHFPP